MNLEPIIQSEVSQKEKDKYHILTHIWNLEKLSYLQIHGITISTEKPLCFRILKNYPLPALPRLRQTPVFEQLANSLQMDAAMPTSIRRVAFLGSFSFVREGGRRTLLFSYGND